MKASTLLLLTVCLAACSDSQPIRIGAKDFTEQRVLAEMVARVLKDDGWAVESVVQCGDTYSCYAALQAGELDLLVDYTGTGFVFRGAVAPASEDGLADLRRLYEPLGLTWLSTLGFDNGYILVVRGDAARGRQVTEISELAAAEPGLRVACPGEFLRRPLDGLQSLVRRYGLRMPGDPLVEDDPQQRVTAVLDGRADVAVLYGTDAAALDPRLMTLADDLDFFPEYEAALVARLGALRGHKGLADSLARLDGAVSRESMRRLNQEVQLEGATAAAVAATFLVENELLSNPEVVLPQTPDLVIAMHEADKLKSFEGRALTAVRGAYPHRTVVLRSASAPVADTRGGRARLTLLGAERFFAGDQRDDRIEAVVAVGSRRIHHLCRLDLTDEAGARIGIPMAKSGGGIAAARVLSLLGRQPAFRGPRSTLVRKAEVGELDCVMLLTEAGDTEVGQVLKRGVVGLRDLPDLGEDLRQDAPYLRPTRIPAGTYHGQGQAIETLGAQVLLAGPGRAAKPLEATGGPATALPASGQPIPADRVQAMAAASGFHEAPDPVLPSAWERSLGTRTGGRTSGGPMDAILNGLVFLFLGWLIYLVFRRD